MSDKDYESFLESASASKPQAQAQTKSESFQTSAHPLPKSLAAADQHTYESESDEPFTAVNLDWSGDILDASSLSDVLGKDVQEIKRKEFDARGRYADVVELVTSASAQGQDVRFFRADGKGARVEYFVLVLLDSGSGPKGAKRVVGVRAVAVES